MKNRVIKLLAGAVGLLMLAMGLQWLIMPGAAAEGLGMTLDVGLGLSTQIGDLSAFFLTAGICTLIGLATRVSSWFYAAALLLGLTAFGRTVAWLVHDASLAIPQVPAEIVMVLILLTAARQRESAE